MNLLTDKWLTVIRKDDSKDIVSICEMFENYDENPIIDIETPRADFKSSIYQLLIGIVQVSVCPDDDEVWNDFWNKPHKNIKSSILKYQDCFEIDSDGPAFMQDFDLKEPKKEGLKNLFLDFSSHEHFNKRTYKQIDPYWGAITLFTLQISAPFGGRGNRTGLRGGGPLTIIALPENKDLIQSTLWEKIWINIISIENVKSESKNLQEKSDIFPWMKETRISIKGTKEINSNECNPFHVYFGMPRRIRLIFSGKSGICDLTKKECNNLVVGYYSRPSGNNYDDFWVHPLSSYIIMKEGIPSSIKGKEEGIKYKHWSKLSFENEKQKLALNIQNINTSIYKKKAIKNRQVILWTSGYNVDGMKAKKWCDSTMPLYFLNEENSKKVQKKTEAFIEIASKIYSNIKFAVKNAWFPGSKKSFEFKNNEFWNDTESMFFVLVDKIIKNIENTTILNECVDQWGNYIKKEAMSIFENVCLNQMDNNNMKRIIIARKILNNSNIKAVKNLNKILEEA